MKPRPGVYESISVFMSFVFLLNGTTGALSGPSVTKKCPGMKATIMGTGGDDELDGTGKVDVIVGLGGQDSIYGAEGDDVICGGRASDLLIGSSGDDRVFGGLGGDFTWGDETCCYSPSPGDDVLDGGGGADWAAFQGAPSPLRVDLAKGRAEGEGHDILRSIRHVVGRIDGNNLLKGNERSNFLGGGDFTRDTLEGRGGSDVLDGTCCYRFPASDVRSQALRTVPETPETWLFRARQRASADGLSSPKPLGPRSPLSRLGASLTGGLFKHHRVADKRLNSDAFLGGKGNDLAVVRNAEGDNFLRGGTGRDGASYSFLTSGPAFIIADLEVGELTVYSPWPPTPQPTDALLSIEDLAGTSGRDVIGGTEGRNDLRGFRGADSIAGRRGDDELYGGEGNDVLRGGQGADRCVQGENNTGCET